MPNNWKTYKLGEIADVQNGYAFKASELVGNGIPVIKIKNIISPNVSIEDVSFFNGNITSNLEKFIAKKGDFLISMTGSTVNVMSSAVGKMGRYRINDVSLINQRVGKIFITKPEIVSFEYLCQYLNRYEIHYNLALNATGSANQANISPAQIKDINVLLPSLQEQQSIASILSAIDDKIENNLAINKTLEEMAMALYKHWFVDFGPFQDGEFVESELGLIPKGWEIGYLKDILKFKKNNIDPSETTKMLPYVPIDCIKSKQLLLNEFKSGEDAKSSLIKFEKGDFILGAMRVYFHKLCIAPFEGTSRSTAFVFNTHNENQYSYGLCLLNDENTISFAASNSQGSTIPYAKWDKVLSDMKIIIPSDIILNDFQETISIHLNKIIEIFHENQSLNQLRDTLLPKLICGEVRLKEYREN